ncbi:efflux transporter periplasmic adaptor subunit [Rhodanobacter thiooxydans]|uniref:Efflux transporter periplasmic adaptor subunit n=1 Tax=Rhodanobacter thiooxydans TaxID=416169 RepID=A0A154QJZ5_9GAMM|nr:efflux RND transporter periplasmic adaptor subunit [Rhodanobacter thiooxydans]EIM00934.1 secretion protein HlyD [Rhodanobacter thiooxydans LCS2]KZC24420.1 efflux transporter periplasmic adaptor subunit [Rhodanobacter thiooxydans]MCW0203362.1 efflux RND transporter periplasmic adaptor subunit [Rhodanobacter thiooxydans]
MPWRPAAFVFALGALLAAAGCSSRPETQHAAVSDTPQNVTMTPAQRQRIHLFTVAPASFHRAIETTGVVDFDNDQATSVLAPFSGSVARLLVAPGDKVRQGQPLALVDSPDFSAAIGAYRKALANARNTRRLADIDKDLVQHEGVSRREAEQAQTDAASAEADRDAALQALVALHVDAGTIEAIQSGGTVARVQGIIRAPVAGTVVEKLITPGQLLQAGTTPCFTVADLSKVWVMAQVPAAELAGIRVGDPAQVETAAPGGELAGTVDNIAAVVNPDTRAVAARIVVSNPQGVLRKQMYARVRIQSRQASKGLLVPASALLRDDDNLPFVYLAQPDGSFARRHVTTGSRTGDDYLVSDGLQPGERIVVDGGIFVQFMQNQ